MAVSNGGGSNRGWTTVSMGTQKMSARFFFRRRIRPVSRGGGAGRRSGRSIASTEDKRRFVKRPCAPEARWVSASTSARNAPARSVADLESARTVRCATAARSAVGARFASTARIGPRAGFAKRMEQGARGYVITTASDPIARIAATGQRSASMAGSRRFVSNVLAEVARCASMGRGGFTASRAVKVTRGRESGRTRARRRPTDYNPCREGRKCLPTFVSTPLVQLQAKGLSVIHRKPHKKEARFRPRGLRPRARPKRRLRHRRYRMHSRPHRGMRLIESSCEYSYVLWASNYAACAWRARATVLDFVRECAMRVASACDFLRAASTDFGHPQPSRGGP